MFIPHPKTLSNFLFLPTVTMRVPGASIARLCGCMRGGRAGRRRGALSAKRARHARGVTPRFRHQTAARYRRRRATTSDARRVSTRQVCTKTNIY